MYTSIRLYTILCLFVCLSNLFALWCCYAAAVFGLFWFLCWFCFVDYLFAGYDLSLTGCLFMVHYLWWLFCCLCCGWFAGWFVYVCCCVCVLMILFARFCFWFYCLLLLYCFISWLCFLLHFLVSLRVDICFCLFVVDFLWFAVYVCFVVILAMVFGDFVLLHI